MKKGKILGTGLSGMIGSKLVELLSPQYEFEDLSLKSGVDIRDKEQVFAEIEKSEAPVVLHLAAMTDVDACEKNPSSCWAVNVLGTENVVAACRKFGKKIIYASTDFVFDGKKKGEYTEEDVPQPINFYGKTKFFGEKCVQKAGIEALICRFAYPFGSKSVQKKDFVQKIRDKLSRREEILALIDHIFCPTLIDDIATVLYKLLQSNICGVYHLVGSQALTPYQATLAIAKMFAYDRKLIKKTTMKEFYKGRAPRPQNLALDNKKIKKLGMRMRGFEEGLKLLNPKF